MAQIPAASVEPLKCLAPRKTNVITRILLTPVLTTALDSRGLTWTAQSPQRQVSGQPRTVLDTLDLATDKTAKPPTIDRRCNGFLNRGLQLGQLGECRICEDFPPPPSRRAVLMHPNHQDREVCPEY
jgi:hypothetical protein